MSPRVGFIGTGWPDRLQIPAFSAAGFEVVGVAGRSLERARAVAEAHGLEHAFSDPRELLALDCDLVCVSSPPAQHLEHSLLVLEAGQNLLCEKPMTLTAREGERLLEATRVHAPRLALVDHELRFTPARRKAKELLAAGAVGRILTVTVRIANNMRLDPQERWNWWSEREQGGGILNALGSHAFDGLLWLLGDSLGDIELRGAVLGRSVEERPDAEGWLQPVTSDDIVSCTFRMGAAVGTLLIHGVAQDESVDLLTVRGDEGTLVIDKSLKLYLGKRKGSLKEYVTHLPGVVPNRYRSSPYAAGTVLYAQALADALSGRIGALEGAATLEDGLQVQRLLDRARELADA